MDSDENEIYETLTIEELIDIFTFYESDNIFKIYDNLNYNFPWLFEKCRCSGDLLFFIADFIYQPGVITRININNKFINEFSDDIYSTLYIINNYFKFNENKKLRKYKIPPTIWSEYLFKNTI